MAGPTKEQLQQSLNQRQELVDKFRKGLTRLGIDASFVRRLGEEEPTPEEQATFPGNAEKPGVLTQFQVRQIEEAFEELRLMLRVVGAAGSDGDSRNIRELHELEAKVTAPYYAPIIQQTKKRLTTMMHEADAAGEPLPSPMTPVRIYTWLRNRDASLDPIFAKIESSGECMEEVLREAGDKFRKEVAIREKKKWIDDIMAKRGIEKPTEDELDEASRTYNDAAQLRPYDFKDPNNQLDEDDEEAA